MAITTAGTYLKYTTNCNAQIETATVVGTITTGGNATVIVTSRDVVGSPITFNVAVSLNDTASQVAGKIRNALGANANLTAVYNVGGTTTSVVLTRVYPEENDSALNISIANGTCEGLTNALTSVNTLAGGTFTVLCPITSYPDMGSSPSKLDSTTLDAIDYKTNEFGLQELGDLIFEANYDEALYADIIALIGTKQYFMLQFGTNDGKYNWKGECVVFPNGGAVDEIRKMTITLSSETPVHFTVTN